MKNVVCIGDSFTYGDELEDRSMAWPSLLANNLNCNVINLGTPGGSNDKFIRQIFEEYKNFDLIILSWTHPCRFEIKVENVFVGMSPGIAEVRNNSWAIEYYKKYYSNFDAHFRWLVNVLMLQSFFKQTNQKYIFCSTFGTNRTLDKNEQQEYIPIFQKMIEDVDRKHYLGWHQYGMLDWVTDCPAAPGGHPLELGHQRIADKINEHIRNLGWLP